MKRIIFLFLAVLSCVSDSPGELGDFRESGYITMAEPGPGFVRCSGPVLIDPDGHPLLLRGIGLGGWLVPEGYMLHIPGFGSPSSIYSMVERAAGKEGREEFIRHYREQYVNERDIAAIAGWGINSIRLPFHYNLFFNNNTGKCDEKGFDLVNRFIEWCREYRLYVILDMHCAPGGQNPGNISDSDGTARLWLEKKYRKLTIKVWKEIARRYADEDIIIGYDLLNEPVLPPGVSGKKLRDLYINITKAIREVDANHIIIVEGNVWATTFDRLFPPFDNNMVYSFHKYWDSTEERTIHRYITARDTYKVPLWAGEFGENSNPWIHEVITLFEKNNIGWCYWTHKKVDTISVPYSCRQTTLYKKALNYLSAKGRTPSEQEAREVLYAMVKSLSLDKNLSNNNCDFHPGVVESLMDPDYGSISKPFREFRVPCVIPAVDYDMGTDGVAYGDRVYKHETGFGNWVAWNDGKVYRNDGVDIREVKTIDRHYFYVESEAGEWINYTFQCAQEGNFGIELVVSARSDKGVISLDIDTTTIVDELAVPGTGTKTDWRSIKTRAIHMSPGSHTLTLRFIRGTTYVREIIIFGE